MSKSLVAAYQAYRALGVNAVCAMWYARNCVAPQVAIGVAPVYSARLQYGLLHNGTGLSHANARLLWAIAYRAARLGA